MYRDFGAAVATLHSLRFSVFGELTAGGLVSSDGSYVSALLARARRRLRLLSSESYADLFEATVEDFEPEAAECLEVEPTFVVHLQATGFDARRSTERL